MYANMALPSLVGCSINPELGFSSKDHIKILSSCYGFILLTSKTKKNQLNFHVFNPLANQIFTLPQPSFARKIVRSGLVASHMHHHHFQVVLVHISSGSALEFGIFSSETGEWKTHTPGDLFSPVPVKQLFPEPPVPSLYSNGSIHWEVLQHLLVYNVKTGHCQFIKLPDVSEDGHRHKPSTRVFKRCLWESEGRVRYCYTDNEGIHTWYLLNEEDVDFHIKYHNIDAEKFKWALSDSLSHQTFRGLSRNWKPQDIAPFAYNEASQKMFLQLPGSVISYNTKSGVLEEVFTFKIQGKKYNCSFFPFVYCGQGKLQYVDEKSEAKVEIELPVKEVGGFLSF
ncbi:hypothetical protein Patl1_08020 [Pistacia atlantica]|uniref:Uncharacterized protein n=1 Tax=Pistacia atlantica TaxID=434234 RepID=A0ACC1AIH0_9ROSI|nr:hypothetical protein Patl1_08020 [Pistacia atlantica]